MSRCRKPIPKSVRKLVYAKYNGHCAYCGCEIPEKGFNVDHLYCLRRYEYTEEFTGINVHDISNLMPSCGSCNRYKSTMDLEKFPQTVAENTGQTEKGCVYIQHSIEIRHGAGKQRTD